MGIYLNSKTPFQLFCDEAAAAYFVDKSQILYEFIPLVESSEEMLIHEGRGQGKDNRYICVTRPRRFGKTLAASMIAAFFGKGKDSRAVFENLKIGSCKQFEAHNNRHNVIFISFNQMPDECTTYIQYISRIILASILICQMIYFYFNISGNLLANHFAHGYKRILRSDLKKAFPAAEIHDDDAIWDILTQIYESEENARFIFVLDEWDYIFHRDFADAGDRLAYIDFLSNLLKGNGYVEFVYMTGILPIAKYSSGSELNMFCEYTMAAEEKYSEYFGFTETEVDALFERYQRQNQGKQHVTREGLRAWYDGYHTKSGKKIYNPRSVVFSLINNNLASYWTSSGPYDEIFHYIEKDISQVREDLALMISGIPVPAKVREYASTSMNLSTKDEIFSAMVVYGFLNYENGYVSIPNKELMDKFADMAEKETSLGYVHRLAKESRRMLEATKNGDTKAMVEILEYAHNTESPLLSYSNEAELAAVVRLVYLEARDFYRIEREDKAGIGYVDFIFYPMLRSDDCIILELKVDRPVEEAIQQIKDRQYALRFRGKLGAEQQYTGRVLAVGLAYAKKDKKHSCMVEVL